MILALEGTVNVTNGVVRGLGGLVEVGAGLRSRYRGFRVYPMAS